MLINEKKIFKKGYIFQKESYEYVNILLYPYSESIKIKKNHKFRKKKVSRINVGFINLIVCVKENNKYNSIVISLKIVINYLFPYI